MLKLIAIKALAGLHYVRPDQVIAVSSTEQSKCNVYLTGGVSIPCHESAKDVIAKLGAAAEEEKERAPHGHGEG
jgi:hypothetical protein